MDTIDITNLTFCGLFLRHFIVKFENLFNFMKIYFKKFE